MDLESASEKPSNQGSEDAGIRVLVVDANSRQAAATRRALKAPPTLFVVSPARQLWSAVQILSGVPIDIVLLSMELARSDAEQPADAEAHAFPGLMSLQTQAAEIPIVVMGPDQAQGASVVQAGASDFVLTSPEMPPETLRQRTIAAYERGCAKAQLEAAAKALQAAVSMRILLVDEDSLVLRLLRRNLERRGHRVTPHQSPHEAIEFAKSASFGFDLLVCDERIGGMEGQRLSEILRRYAPALRTLLFSGQSPAQQDKSGAGMQSRFYLQKPYTLSELGETFELIESGYPWPETIAQRGASDARYLDPGAPKVW